MKVATILQGVCALLLFGAAACLFLQAGHGSLIYFSSGVGIQPLEIGKLLILLVLLLETLFIALVIDARARRRRLIWAVPLAWLLLLVVFPLGIEGRLWSEASYADGRPMTDERSGERVKSWDAFFGYVPLWRARFEARPPYDRYETTDLYNRRAYDGNLLWGTGLLYGLNRRSIPRFDDGSGQVYECELERTRHVLGFYWRDRAGSLLEYAEPDALPADRCRLIDMPAVGSQIRSRVDQSRRIRLMR